MFACTMALLLANALEAEDPVHYHHLQHLDAHALTTELKLELLHAATAGFQKKYAIAATMVLGFAQIKVLAILATLLNAQVANTKLAVELVHGKILALM